MIEFSIFSTIQHQEKEVSTTAAVKALDWMSFHKQRVWDLFEATWQGVEEPRKTDFHMTYLVSSLGLRLVRGCFPCGDGEGAQIACIIHAYIGFATHDELLDPEFEKPRHLVVSSRGWSEAERNARVGALGRVENLVILDTKGIIHEAQWHCLHTVTVCAFGGAEKYDISMLPLEQLGELTLNNATIVSPSAVGVRLALTSFTSYGYDDYPSLLQGSHDTLQHLSMFCPDDILPLCSFPNLRTLNVARVLDSNFAAHNWQSLKRLQRLSLKDVQLTTCSFFTKLPRELTHLYFEGWNTTPNDDFMGIIGQQCPFLEVLDVRACHHITQDGYAALEKECKALRSIRVGNTSFDDAMLRFLAASPFLSQRVTFLDWSFNNSCTDATFVAFLAACPNLGGINLKYSSIRTACLTTNVLTTCPSLKTVCCAKGEELPVPGLVVHYPPVFYDDQK